MKIFTIFQYTLPREERPKPFIYKALRTIISIHAPTRGATSNSKTSASSSVFQSTLPREERRIIQSSTAFSFPFQSTLPREERHTEKGEYGMLYRFQSTLPREERRILRFMDSKKWYFNPRSHERSDCSFLITVAG